MNLRSLICTTHKLTLRVVTEWKMRIISQINSTHAQIANVDIKWIRWNWIFTTLSLNISIHLELTILVLQIGLLLHLLSWWRLHLKIGSSSRASWLTSSLRRWTLATRTSNMLIRRKRIYWWYQCSIRITPSVNFVIVSVSFFSSIIWCTALSLYWK